jgi:hypothetical protein
VGSISSRGHSGSPTPGKPPYGFATRLMPRKGKPASWLFEKVVGDELARPSRRYVGTTILDTLTLALLTP